MQAVGQRIVVAKPKETERRHGSLVIPNTANRDFFVAELVSIGSDIEDDKLHPGQNIFVTGYTSGFKLGERDDKEIIAIDYEDIIAIVDDDDE